LPVPDQEIADAAKVEGDLLLLRFRKHLSTEATDVEAEEVKTLIDMHDPGFGLIQLQSALR
jgi:succinate dehydrogenase flavin-adding protein (antitoxin of CptAB toxin-antitoxin module)